MTMPLAERRWRGRIPRGNGHPLVGQFVDLCNAQQTSLREIQKRSGVAYATIRSWRHRYNPTIDKLDAVLAPLGYRLTIGRLAAAAALLAAMAAAPARAQDAPPGICFPRQDLLAALEKKFQEAPAGVGLSSGGYLVELLRTGDGGTWTLLMVGPGGQACVVDAGENWRELPPPAKGERT